MGGEPKGRMWMAAIALAIIVIAAVTVVALYMIRPAQAGEVSCLFYSAESKSGGYYVYATISNNSTSPVSFEKVYFDGTEQAYSAVFPLDFGDIWAMRVNGQPTKALGSGGIATLLVRATGANPELPHTVRVVTNTTSFEFNVVRKLSSLTFDHYESFLGPGIDYLKAYIGNSGSAPGHVYQVTMDGITYLYVNDSPPKSSQRWSMVVNGAQTQVIGIGQQGIVYIDTSAICHSCTHNVKISCSDGSYVEFTLRPQ